MNMNKALQNLYHAVSGSTTTKVNISKLLVDIHQAITGKESSNKNNWSRIINSMADNWPEGGGGSSDFSTAEVTITNNTERTILATYPYINRSFSDIEGFGGELYSDDSLQLLIPMYINGAYIQFNDENEFTISTTGGCSADGTGVVVTGDGTITIS